MSIFNKKAIESQISKALKAINNKPESKSGLLQESNGEISKSTTKYINPIDFKNQIVSKIDESKKLLQESLEYKEYKEKKIGKSIYTESSFEQKFVNDFSFITTFADKFITESDNKYDELKKLLIESLIISNKLFIESNIKPRHFSQALDFGHELNENSKYNIYVNFLEESLNKNFNKPLLENSFHDKYNKELDLLIESFLVTGEDIQKVDMDRLSRYAIFESCMFDTLKNIIIPESNQKEISSFLKNQPDEYFSMFDDNAQNLLNELDGKIKKITIIISPSVYSNITKDEVPETEITIPEENVSKENDTLNNEIGTSSVENQDNDDIITNNQKEVVEDNTGDDKVDDILPVVDADDADDVDDVLKAGAEEQPIDDSKLSEIGKDEKIEENAKICNSIILEESVKLRPFDYNMFAGASLLIKR